MKEELEKLGFLYDEFLQLYELRVYNNIIKVKSYGEKSVYLTDKDGFIFLFKYNHEKVKQLIEILK